MRWLVTGARGMLGRDLVDMLEKAGNDVTAYDREELDILDAERALVVIHELRPEVIVNCAAWTAVDAAEEHEGDAFAVSAVGAANLARGAQQVSARFIQISTDYVFAGTASSPYAEDTPLAPESAYGRTKAAGEWAVRSECDDALIVRTAWLYGAQGSCFPKTIATAGRSRDALTVVSDQVGQPTWTRDLAGLIIRLVGASAPKGIYHGTSSGKCSWFEFTQEILDSDGQDRAKVSPVTSDEFVRPAPRPAYSVLDHGALAAIGIAPIGDWKERWQAASAEVLAS